MLSKRIGTAISGLFPAMACLLAGCLVAGGVAMAQEAVGVPTPWQMGLQASATPVHEAITDFHNLMLWVCIAISLFVMILLGIVIVRFNAKANPTPSKTSHNTLLEVAWTVVPVIILIVMAVPSFQLLYYQAEVRDADMTIKVTGRQWYWDYEYPDHDIAFSSFMIRDDELQEGQHRLMEVTDRLIVPVDTKIRVQVTAGDVLHAWAVPSFGVKMDAVPGRLNETWFEVQQEGVYYGFCSELCGQDHAFMPIAVEAVSQEAFEDWVGQRQAALTEEDDAGEISLAAKE